MKTPIQLASQNYDQMVLLLASHGADVMRIFHVSRFA